MISLNGARPYVFELTDFFYRCGPHWVRSRGGTEEPSILNMCLGRINWVSQRADIEHPMNSPILAHKHLP